MQSTSYMERRSATWRGLPIDLISRSPIARWAPIPLRLIVGYGFMEHGFAKLARGLDAFLGGSGPLAIDGLLVKAQKSRTSVENPSDKNSPRKTRAE
jgi:hypothetical protein